MPDQRVLMGNEAVAWGLVTGGCQVVTSYPGTPSSEILPAVLDLRAELGADVSVEWSLKEMVAFQVALGASYAGKRSATIMKQVGLNVAADALMSSAYTGCKGGFVIVSADDPGPYSSQTEQDTRGFAQFAKVPVLDPATPQEACAYAKLAVALSERFEIPVILRPSLRVCHARQTVTLDTAVDAYPPAAFGKNPNRWAATPKYRLELHRELNRKLEAIRAHVADERALTWADPGDGARGIIAGGVLRGMVQDWAAGRGLTLPLFHVGCAFPLPAGPVAAFIGRHERVLVLEETGPVIEQQIADRSRVAGRLDGRVPAEGEIDGQRLDDILCRFLDLKPVSITVPENPTPAPARRPTLCPACPHRNSFHAIRKALPKGIYTGDIGCYTLGVNMKAVDTVLVMGASIGLAMGIHQAYRQDGREQPIVATIGDSTFLHSGLPQLANAVYNDSRIIVVILDNEVTAMTGMQPAVSTGARIDGTPGRPVRLEDAVRGCGVRFLEIRDPYAMDGCIEALRAAHAFTRQPDGGVAVLIFRHPCVLNDPRGAVPAKRPVSVDPETCTGCKICMNVFQCPAIIATPAGKAAIDRRICAQCGNCIAVCPSGAIREQP